MSIVLDLIVVAIVAIFVFTTMRHGFVKSFLNLAALILTVVIVSSCGKILASTAYDAFFKKSIQKTVNESVSSASGVTEVDIKTTFDKLPALVRNSAENAGITTEKLTKTVGTSKEKLASTIENDVIRPVACSFIQIIIQILLFALLMFLFSLVIKFLCTLFKAPVLSHVNKALGALLGFVKGVVIAAIVCCLISYVVSVSRNGEFLIFTKSAIDQSVLFKALSSYVMN